MQANEQPPEPAKQQPSANPVVVEAVIALVAAWGSWLVIPAEGIVMHWDIDGTPGWSLGPFGFALVAAVVTFVMGHFITVFVASRTGFSWTWPAPVALGVFWVAQAGFQLIGLGAASFGWAGALGVACYFAPFWPMLRRAQASGRDEADPE
ncbi:hypothetical protein [Leucobacter aridicollis]|uniref:DUF1648 domain-containing protein n=1 Tax=Leucobacter aridicollis TaxID=283878 RepID=A0A852R2X0_9MICO|nr:hypothetical protein [Leucobacter aridicollis]MBL3681928.1 hypothetical protein [Leucobacter aridicollis]NYD27027.1 hypothetical protein [Leucobacter aridicollis]